MPDYGPCPGCGSCNLIAEDDTCPVCGYQPSPGELKPSDLVNHPSHYTQGRLSDDQLEVIAISNRVSEIWRGHFWPGPNTPLANELVQRLNTAVNEVVAKMYPMPSEGGRSNGVSDKTD